MKKELSYLCFILLLCFAWQDLLSQQRTIDSLKTSLLQAKADTQKVELYEELSFYWIRSNMKMAEAYRDSSYLIAQKISDKKFTAYAEIADASILLSKSLFRNAINHYLKSNEYLGKSEPILQGANYSDMGYCYHAMGITDSFYYYSIKAIKIFEQYKREDKLVRTYGNMAYILTTLRKFEDAKKYFKIADDLAIKVHDDRSLSKSIHNQGVMYESLNMPDSALYFYQEALKLKAKMGDSLGLSTTYSGIAGVYLTKKQFPLFLKNIRQGIYFAKKMNNIGYEANGYFSIGTGYYTIDKFDSCIFYMNKSAAILKEIGDIRQVSDCYMYLAECYDLKKDYKQALEFHKLYKTYYDSVFTMESTEQLESLKLGFETEKKEEQNVLLKAQNELSNETIQQQKTIVYIIIAGLLITIGLAFFIFKGLKKQRKANQIISHQKRDVETKNHIIEEKQKEILDSIHYAKRIQDTLLAHRDYLDEQIQDNFIFFKPKDIVSGDFYWATNHSNKFYLAVCDSTGHGVPGAFMSLLNVNFLNEAINEKNILEPNEIFNYARQRLITSISKDGQQDGFDGILLCIDTNLGKITYAAANNAPILVSGNQFVELEKDKMPVGKGEKNDSFKLFSLDYKKGDTLYLYTDGYADQFGGDKGKKFKYSPLNKLLFQLHQQPMESQVIQLNDTFEKWRGSLEQVDDVCIVGIRL